jgi:hypothetical protein
MTTKARAFSCAALLATIALGTSALAQTAPPALSERNYLASE